MNSKMTTNSQLSITESKKQKQKQKQTKKTTRTGTESRNGDHTEGYQQVEVSGKIGEEVQGIRSINGRYKIDRGRLRIV